eukprot:365469-Chlamydomonas_euryale.AAC.8
MSTTQHFRIADAALPCHLWSVAASLVEQQQPLLERRTHAARQRPRRRRRGAAPAATPHAPPQLLQLKELHQLQQLRDVSVRRFSAGSHHQLAPAQVAGETRGDARAQVQPRRPGKGGKACTLEMLMTSPL